MGFLESHVLFISGSISFSCSAFFLPFPPSLVDLVSIGLVSISTDLVSVTVPCGWLPLAGLPRMPVPCSGLVTQGSLLAPESPPTFAGTISKHIYW